MADNPNGGRFMSMQPGSIDKTPHDIRQYWTPERKKAARPISMLAATDAVVPEAANAEPATDPKQADLTKMPFTACGKLFFTIDSVDYVASANIFMHRNMLLTASRTTEREMLARITYSNSASRERIHPRTFPSKPLP